MLETTDAVVPFSQATSILDIACGQGMVFEKLFESGISLSPSAKLVGMDVNELAISQIQERAKTSTDRWKDVSAWAGDAVKLSVPDNSQSHVLSQMGIFLIPQWDKALQEAHRVLEPSGVFSMSAMSRSAWNDEIIPQVETIHPERKVPRVPQRWRSKDSFAEALQQNGFHDVVVHEVEVKMEYDTPESMVEIFFDVMPHLKPLLQGLSGEQAQEVKAKMASKIKSDYPNHELPGVSLFAVGRK